jgi:hypothetical protein
MSWKQHILLVTSVLIAASCNPDPVLDDVVSAQGKETSGISTGEFHRAGQKCTACHVEGGPASNSPFSIAGTIFAQPAREVGVGAAEVRMTDAEGTKFIAKTNCVGNFFVKPSEWDPHFPVLVEVAKGNVRRAMKSIIGRESSCAGCHSFDITPANPLSQVGHVYVFGGDEPGLPNGAADCPADPVRPGTQ